MRASVVVFPIKGRNWCFSSTPVSASASACSGAAAASSSWSVLWSRLTSGRRPVLQNAEIVADFLAHKMNGAWLALEMSPTGTFKRRMHSLGVRLLSGVKPSEIFLKSLTNDVTGLDIIFPTSLNARLVRRRLRHIATRGLVLHRRYLYGSASLLPLTMAFSILPLPNIPFFWVVFRAYSNWRALQGSQRLFLLVSDYSGSSSARSYRMINKQADESNHAANGEYESLCVMKPSECLERLLIKEDVLHGVSCDTISKICMAYQLEEMVVMKYQSTS